MKNQLKPKSQTAYLPATIRDSVNNLTRAIADKAMLLSVVLEEREAESELEPVELHADVRRAMVSVLTELGEMSYEIQWTIEHAIKQAAKGGAR